MDEAFTDGNCSIVFSREWRCLFPVVVFARYACVHEHVSVQGLCSRHRELGLQPNAWLCLKCLQQDESHDCVLTVHIEHDKEQHVTSGARPELPGDTGLG